MIQYAVPDLIREVETLAVLLEPVDDSENLLLVCEILGIAFLQRFLADVPEGRVSEVVP